MLFGPILLAICHTLEPAFAASPANDDFASSIVLSGTSLRVNGTNAEATKAPEEPAHAGDRGGASVWWAWTAPESGMVRISTENSDFDSLLAIYVGDSINTLASIAANDDEDGGIVTSLVRFAVTKGITYHIAVDGVWDDEPATGLIRLTLAMDAPPRIDSILVTDSRAIRLLCTATPGRLVDIEASADLLKWITIGQVLNTQGAFDFFDPDPIALHTSRSYRIRQEP